MISLFGKKSLKLFKISVYLSDALHLGPFKEELRERYNNFQH